MSNSNDFSPQGSLAVLNNVKKILSLLNKLKKLGFVLIFRQMKCQGMSGYKTFL